MGMILYKSFVFIAVATVSRNKHFCYRDTDCTAPKNEK